jgi:hypothetical protein
MAVTVTPYLITIDPGTYTAFDLWDAWRDWVMAGNANYLPAFEQSGGVPLTGSEIQAIYLFLQNQYGWRITSSDPTNFVILDVNLYPADTNTTMFQLVSGVQPPVQIERSVKSIAIEVGGSSLTSGESTQLRELWQLQGLDSDNPLSVSTSRRETGSIVQNISGDGVTSSTVERQ